MKKDEMKKGDIGLYFENFKQNMVVITDVYPGHYGIQYVETAEKKNVIKELIDPLNEDDINFCQLLKPYIGMTFYNPFYGDIILRDVNSNHIRYEPEGMGIEFILYQNGKFSRTTNCELMIFPSKEKRDWKIWINVHIALLTTVKSVLDKDPNLIWKKLMNSADEQFNYLLKYELKKLGYNSYEEHLASYNGQQLKCNLYKNHLNQFKDCTTDIQFNSVNNNFEIFYNPDIYTNTNDV